MKNKFLSLLVVFGLLFSLSACTQKQPPAAGNTPDNADTPMQEDTQEPTLSEKLRQLYEDPQGLQAGSVAKLIAENQPEEAVVYNVSKFQNPALDQSGEILGGGSLGPYMLDHYDDYYPVTNLQQIDEKLIYTCYTAQDDAGNTYSVYVFFEQVGKDGKEIWWITGRVFYVQQMLASSDFQSISPGSSFEDVAAIDPGALIQKGAPRKSFSTYHYLQDGILHITYARTDETQPFTVSETELVEDFAMPGFDGDPVYLNIHK